MGVGREQIKQRSLICQPADTPSHRDVPIGAYFCVDGPITGANEPTGWSSQLPGLSQAKVMESLLPVCVTADIGPICIDEAADHPARRKSIVVSTLHREKAASAAEITESRTVILIDLSQNCARGAL